MPRSEFSGFFITLDGVDGTGKSTQCRLLVERLHREGKVVTPCADPGATELGTALRQLLLHGHEITARAEALLFMAARAEMVEKVIRPALLRGEFVVSDRFLIANLVYQGYAGGVDLERLRTVGEFCVNGVTPDLMLLLDLPIEAARKRLTRDQDRVERRGADYHERVRQGFLAEATIDPERRLVVDASPTVDELHETIFRLVAEYAARRM